MCSNGRCTGNCEQGILSGRLQSFGCTVCCWKPWEIIFLSSADGIIFFLTITFRFTCTVLSAFYHLSGSPLLLVDCFNWKAALLLGDICLYLDILGCFVCIWVLQVSSVLLLQTCKCSCFTCVSQDRAAMVGVAIHIWPLLGRVSVIALLVSWCQWAKLMILSTCFFLQHIFSFPLLCADQAQSIWSTACNHEYFIHPVQADERHKPCHSCQAPAGNRRQRFGKIICNPHCPASFPSSFSPLSKDWALTGCLYQSLLSNGGPFHLLVPRQVSCNFTHVERKGIVLNVLKICYNIPPPPSQKK